MVACDGYAAAPGNKPLVQDTGGSQQLVRPLLLETRQLTCPDVFSNVDEMWLFRHFRDCTRTAFSSLGPVEFWGHYVVPLTASSEPVRYAIVAVAAAHQLFLSRSAAPTTCAPPSQLECVAIQQYNKAIAYIKALISMDSPYDVRCVLVCCLLFVCLESMSGRYSESIRHLKAGSQLLTNLQLRHDAGLEISNELADTFARFGIGTSIFMEEAIMPCKPDDAPGVPFQVDPDPRVPFSSLNEASISLRQIDVHYVHLMFSGSDSDSSLADRGAAFTLMEHRLTVWSSRFDETVRALESQVVSDARSGTDYANEAHAAAVAALCAL